MSNNSDRKTSVPKYFVSTPDKPKQPLSPSKTKLIIGLITGVIGLIYGLGLLGIYIPIISNMVFLILWYIPIPLVIIALLLLVISGVMLSGWYSTKKETGENYQQKMTEYRKKYDLAEPKPSDTQMDIWLEEDINEIKRDALEKLDLNDEDMIHDPDDPIIVIGPAQKAHFAIGKDFIIRFSIYDILLIYLTEYHLAAYKCTLDFATKIRKFESTQEYHYTDVVSVSTKTGSDLAFTYNGETKSLANYQQFALSVASGESINVATPVSFSEQLSSAAEIIENGKLPDSGADKAIRVIRNRLREKKGGAIS